MTTFNWKITQCARLTADGYITTAQWTCTGVEGDYTGSVYATCSFPEGTPSTPYDQITEADVLGWCWTNGVDKDATEAAITAQINAQKNPATASGTPW